jgi:hypothetical protein
MTVEVLYFEGCPNHERLLPRLRDLLDELAPNAELVLRQIETVDQAERERFLGSPTVRVDGLDVDPGASTRRDYGLECRLYRTSQGASPLPPESWIEQALARSR